MQLSHFSPTTRLATEWSDQLLHLAATLSDDPDNQQAWRWRIRIKILRFLLSRYGGDVTFEPRVATNPARLWIWNVLSPMIGKRPRSRHTIRMTLERIAEVNRNKPL